MEKLYKQGLYLEYFTVGYTVFEAIASIAFGSVSNSIALVGFGLDSVVESLSGLVLIWRLSQHRNLSKEQEEKIEQQAMKFIAATFLLLGAYVLFESARDLIFQEIPEPSLPGIIIAISSIIIMPILAYKKYQTGKQINSKALMADSKETFVCSLLSLTLLLGLGANYLFGFWQADNIASLIIVLFLVREGLEVWEESNDDDDDD